LLSDTGWAEKKRKDNQLDLGFRFDLVPTSGEGVQEYHVNSLEACSDFIVELAGTAHGKR